MHSRLGVRVGDDDGIREAETLAQLALGGEPARAGVHDLDADDAALARLRQHAPRFPAGDAQQRTDLILRLVLVVVELGDTHRQQLVVHRSSSVDGTSRSGALHRLSKSVLI